MKKIETGKITSMTPHIALFNLIMFSLVLILRIGKHLYPDTLNPAGYINPFTLSMASVILLLVIIVVNSIYLIIKPGKG